MDRPRVLVVDDDADVGEFLRDALSSFSYDVTRGQMLNQRISGFYNSQCCGIAFDYQTFSYGGVTSIYAIPSDHRFFLSFTLAGLGNFSPFNGAMSGIPR